MTPNRIGYDQTIIHDMKTGDLLHILLVEPLTSREVRIIKAELKSREI